MTNCRRASALRAASQTEAARRFGPSLPLLSCPCYYPPSTGRAEWQRKGGQGQKGGMGDTAASVRSFEATGHLLLFPRRIPEPVLALSSPGLGNLCVVQTAARISEWEKKATRDAHHSAITCPPMVLVGYAALRVGLRRHPSNHPNITSPSR